MNNGKEHINTKISDREYSDVEVWWLLIQAGRAMDRIRTRELLRYGISRQEAGILVAVDMIGHRSTQAEISRWTLHVPHSISSLVGRMEVRGLVKKVWDLDRRNLSRIKLTEKGQQALSQVVKRESTHELLSILSKEERQQLATIIFKLRDAAIIKLGANKPRFPHNHST